MAIMEFAMQQEPVTVRKGFWSKLGDEIRAKFWEGYRQNQTSQLLSSNSVIVGIAQERDFKPVVVWKYVSETSEEEDKELRRLGITPGHGLFVCDLLPKFYVVSQVGRGKMNWYVMFPDESKSPMFSTKLADNFPDEHVRDIIMATLYPELLVAERLELKARKKQGAKRVKRTPSKNKKGDS